MTHGNCTTLDYNANLIDGKTLLWIYIYRGCNTPKYWQNWTLYCCKNTSWKTKNFTQFDAVAAAEPCRYPRISWSQVKKAQHCITLPVFQHFALFAMVYIAINYFHWPYFETTCDKKCWMLTTKILRLSVRMSMMYWCAGTDTAPRRQLHQTECSFLFSRCIFAVI